MPFDPTQPADFSPLDPAVMRDQLNALDQKISTALASKPEPEPEHAEHFPERSADAGGGAAVARYAFNALLNQITRV